MLDTLYIAVFAVVFSYILIDEDMIFGFYGRLLNRIPDKLSFPLGECAYCFGGQIALWYYPLKNFRDYHVDTHIFFIAITIFLIHLTRFIYEQTN